MRNLKREYLKMYEDNEDNSFDPDGRIYACLRTEQEQRNKERRRQLYQNRKHPTSLYDKEWLKANREKLLKDYLGRKGINSKADPFTFEEWVTLIGHFKRRCAYCSVEFTTLNPPEKDHIIPISKGGSNTKNNIVPACRSCNSKKGNKLSCYPFFIL